MTIVADLLIGYRMVRERFTSRVVLSRPGRIDVSYSEGPFRYLNNHWLFVPQTRWRLRSSTSMSISSSARACCRRSSSMLFNEAVTPHGRRLRGRAQQLYGAVDPGGRTHPTPA